MIATAPGRVAFRAMGCGASVVLEARGAARAGPAAANLARLLDAVPRWFARWECALSRFLPGSELRRVNARAGRRTHVSRSFLLALSAALAAARWSDGLITPTVLSALERAGYDRDFSLLGDAPRAHAERPDGADGAAPVADWRAIELDPASRALLLPRGVHLDLGGTAKGWAADRVAALLAPFGAALVDAGGDLALSGPRPSGEPWTIRIADPFEPAAELARLHVDRGGVATSGRDHRRWRRGDRWAHHVIDPRSGAPAETDVVSATVIGRSAWEAEVAAKVVVILGSERGLAWLERDRALAGLAVREDGGVRTTTSMQAYLIG